MDRKFTLIYSSQEEVLNTILERYKTGVKIIDIDHGPLKIDLEEPIPYRTSIKKSFCGIRIIHRGRFSMVINSMDIIR